MSEWKYFFADFASRTSTILDDSFDKAVETETEVTLLLVIAASGLTIPFERLKKNPPSNEAGKHPAAADKLKKLCRLRFVGSPLWQKQTSGSWRHIRELTSIVGHVDDWTPNVQNAPELSRTKVDGKEARSCDTVIRHIRNALSHGNIFSRGKPVKELVFLSRLDDENQINARFSLLKVSPDDFLEFLFNWFSFLESIRPQR